MSCPDQHELAAGGADLVGVDVASQPEPATPYATPQLIRVDSQTIGVETDVLDVADAVAAVVEHLEANRAGVTQELPCRLSGAVAGLVSLVAIPFPTCRA